MFAALSASLAQGLQMISLLYRMPCTFPSNIYIKYHFVNTMKFYQLCTLSTGDERNNKSRILCNARYTCRLFFLLLSNRNICSTIFRCSIKANSTRVRFLALSFFFSLALLLFIVPRFNLYIFLTCHCNCPFFDIAIHATNDTEEKQQRRQQQRNKQTNIGFYLQVIQAQQHQQHGPHSNQR